MSAAPLPTDRPDLARPTRLALIAGLAGVAVCAAGALIDRPHFFRAWLFAFCFTLSLSLGSLVVLMLNYLVGGNWGFVLRRPLEAAARTLPVVTLFFVPVMLGMTELYEWTDKNLIETDKIIRGKTPYLNVPFFLIRAAIYFAIWNLLAGLLTTWSRRQDTARSPAVQDRCAALSAPGLILYALTITFASIDWVMSLEPHWYSTIFMPIFGMGQVLTAFVFCIAVLLLAARRPAPPAPEPPRASHREGFMPGQSGVTADVPSSTQPAPDVPIPIQTLSDLGTLTLAFTMVWAYLSFCQFLLIYAGNLPLEVTYYSLPTGGKRFDGAWGYVATALLALGFFLPFFLLLNPSVKRVPRRLLAVVLWVLAMRALEMLWVIVPAFNGRHHHGPEEVSHGFPIFGALLYPAALVGLGGLWLAFYLWQLGQTPLLPQYNPEEAVGHGQVAHH